MSKINSYDMDKVMMLRLHSINLYKIAFLQKSKTISDKHVNFHVF